MDQRRDRDALLALTAGRQQGTFTFAQALAMGYPRATISRRLAAEVWRRVHPGVFALAGAPWTRESALWAATLAVGPAASITHEASALVHGAERLPADPITLTVPHRWHHRIPGLFVHQIDDLRPQDRARMRGLPVSRPARSVVELAATQPASVVGRVMDDLVAAKVTTIPAIATSFAAVARPGKPGVAKLSALLEERSDGYVPPQSELERALFAALAAGGLPAPARQIPLPGRGGVRGVADAGYTDVLVLLEADGRRWHQRVDAMRADRARDAQAVRAGWVPLRFVYEQLVHAPRDVCEVVLDVRARRAAQLGRSAA